MAKLTNPVSFTHGSIEEFLQDELSFHKYFVRDHEQSAPEMKGKREPIDNTDDRFFLFPQKDPLDQLHDEDSQLRAHTK